jgi:hypothetical protein
VREEVEQAGRGGELHTAAQKELKQIAESLGFLAIKEHQLSSDSLEAVDLYLRRDGIELGCEITVTNTLEYELRNITKILRAGVPLVAVVALETEKLSKLELAVQNSLPPEDSAKVRCFLKPQFVTFLQSIVTQAPAASEPVGVKKRKGWVVKKTVVAISPDEMKQRESELAATMAEAVRRKRGRKAKD